MDSILTTIIDSRCKMELQMANLTEFSNKMVFISKYICYNILCVESK